MPAPMLGAPEEEDVMPGSAEQSCAGKALCPWFNIYGAETTAVIPLHHSSAASTAPAVPTAALRARTRQGFVPTFPVFL